MKFIGQKDFSLSQKGYLKRKILAGVLGFMIFGTGPFAGAQQEVLPVEIDAQEIDVSVQENKVVASGNVSVKRDQTTLFCDRLEYLQKTEIAVAEGHVVLVQGKERLEGEKIEFNFKTMKGDFIDAKLYADPFYGCGRRIDKIADDHYVVQRGYLTTSDYNKPGYRLVSKKIDVYPSDKAVARHVRLVVGNIPLLYIPRYTQDLTDTRPHVTVTPGYDKQWGGFVLTRWRYDLNHYLKGAIHLDYRERKDFAWGVDVEYKTDRHGDGNIRTYYMHERTLSKGHVWQERTEPTKEVERFKIEWRHKWQMDPKTQAFTQFYRLSDQEFLKDYFEREYEEEENPETYFLLTRGLTAGTLSFRTDVRANRFMSTVERLPELNYTLPNVAIFDTNFYLKNSTTVSNLVQKDASPSEVRKSTYRLDTDNELSYPLKVSFVEFRPFVGERHTYYSRTMDSDKYDSVRGIFRTGLDASTKFYRVYEVESDLWGLDIHNLRHVITPSAAYLYQHDPTLPASELNQFDSMDAETNASSVVLSLENKWQTKRNNKSVDLIRAILSTDFLFKEDPGKSGYNNIKGDLEVTPFDWLAFYFDTEYEPQDQQLETVNFDFYINNEDDRWYVKVGKRYHVDVDDLFTAEWGYRINPKWAVKVYERYDFDTATWKEQEYSIRRDLHSWILDMAYNQTRGEGSEVWFVFTLKAFPDVGVNFNTNWNRRKPGAQDIEE